MNSDSAGERLIQWLKRIRHSGEYSDVIVRVGSEEFNLHLFPLLSESTYFQKHVNADPVPIQKSKLVVDLPHFPGGLEIFHIVVDHWYGSVEHEISIENVAEVISASCFLGVESLKNRAFKFLDENVFNCWKSCLTVLATYDCTAIGDELFDRCKSAFLDNIQTKNPLNLPEYADCSMFCNVTHLLTVATLLSTKMAKHIYKCILNGAPGLYYGVEDETTPAAILLYNTKLDEEGNLKYDDGSRRWLEQLPELLPDLAKRATLLSGICELMTQSEDGVTSVLNSSFLCSLLVEVAEINQAIVSSDTLSLGLRKILKEMLDPVIDEMEASVVLDIDEVQPNVLQKCTFATILSMAKYVKSWWPEDHDQDRGTLYMTNDAAKALDGYPLAHLNQNSLSVAQILFVYQTFPTNVRSSHADLYNVFKSMLQSKTMPSEQQQELRQILDFRKLPDTCVQRIFEELELDHEPRLLKRVLEIHEKHAKRLKINEPYETNAERECSLFLKESLVLVKHFNVFMTAAAQVEVANDDCEVNTSCKLLLQQQAVELTALRDAKLKLEAELQVKNSELITMTDEKLRLESDLGDETEKVAAVNKEKFDLALKLARRTEELDVCQRKLEDEREERLCLICFERPRDAQCLPCKHFLYCCTCLNQHMQQSRTCPMCRTPSTGVDPIIVGAS